MGNSKMMKCGTCGKLIAKSSDSCIHCGGKPTLLQRFWSGILRFGWHILVGAAFSILILWMFGLFPKIFDQSFK